MIENYILSIRYEVVECLSQKVRDAVLTDRSHSISKKCRKQLSFELLQRVRGSHFEMLIFIFLQHIIFVMIFELFIFYIFIFFQSESIKLDPKLQSECELDMRKFCPNVTPGNANVRSSLTH